MLRYKNCCKCIGKYIDKKQCFLNKIEGVSDSLFNLIKQCITIMNNKSPVLITGDSGTGKELFAHALHYSCSSKRKNKPFIVKNCGGIDGPMLFNELFGHEEGAFTGALKYGKKGLFELANEGTLFLDEIGDIIESVQIGLLRVIDERKLYRLGGIKTRNINVRIITATNKNITELIKQGKFRKDLYYRLSVFHLKIPSLKKRKEDIFPIALTILNKLSKENKVDGYKLDLKLINDLVNYSWPGNVRELENVLTRAVFSLPEGEMIIKKLYENFVGKTYNKFIESKVENLAEDKKTYEKIKPLKEVEREAIINALLYCDKNKNQAAKMLGISRNTLYRKIEQYKICY